MTNYKEELETIKESLENVIKTLQEELERLNSSELLEKEIGGLLEGNRDGKLLP